MSCCCCSLYLVIGALILYGLRKLIQKINAPNINQKAVFITGCDTGFGRETSIRLAKRGLKVFSGCLDGKSVAELQKESPNIRAFTMDVTKEQSVKETADLIRKEQPEGLWAVINNAGVLRAGLLELMSKADWDIQFNVNVLGLGMVCKYTIPLLRQQKGRMINIASVAGRTAMAGTAAYSGTKFAVEGISDSLRRELRIWGIKVILIEPGVMRTPLWNHTMADDALDRVWQGLNEEQKSLYGKEYLVASEKEGKEMVGKLMNDPIMVVNGLEHAVVTRFPQDRYCIGKDGPLWLFFSYMPSCFSDFVLVRPKHLPAALAGKSKSQ